MLYRLLFFASIVGKILMFRDAVRRGVPSHWFWIIALAPLGEVLYFFVYPWDDPRLRKKRRGWLAAATDPSVERIRRAHKDEPDADNKLRLAQALYDRGMYEEAQTQLESLTRHDEHHREGLYLLGLTRIQREDYEGAIRALSRLVAMRRSYRDFGACLQLALAQYEAGHHDACLETLRTVVGDATSIKHRVILAEYLIKCGKSDEARAQLRKARLGTGDEQWRERAERVLATLEPESEHSAG